MPSLNAHLRQPEQHARLPFHPECPICRRERLVGSLPSDALVSRRTQAALAAGVLAFAAAAPAGTYAQEPDQVTEGAAAPEEIDGADPTHDPDFDPGGESTDLPFDAPPTQEVAAPPDPEDPDAGPLEQEPATDIDAPVADAGDEPTAPQTPSQTPTPPPATSPPPGTPGTSQQPAATATPTPTPEVDAPASSGASGSADADTDANDDDATRVGEHRKKNKRGTAKEPASNTGQAAPPEASVAPASEPAAPATPAAEQTVAAAQTTPAPVLAVARGSRARPGDRTHVVMRGESLWSIAADHLGGQPTVAKIAREVNRLWVLNRDGIGTGSPDLLMVGTRLTLQ
jgi:hypothetical protein